MIWGVFRQGSMTYRIQHVADTLSSRRSPSGDDVVECSRAGDGGLPEPLWETYCLVALIDICPSTQRRNWKYNGFCIDLRISISNIIA